MGEVQTARRRGEQRSMEVQGQRGWMETENTDLYERSKRTQGWDEQMHGWQDGEREGGNERRKWRIIWDSVLLKPLAAY